MDPITAGLNLAAGLLAFGIKIWDATPAPLQAQTAGDWARFAHNIAAVVLDLQNALQLNAVRFKPPA